MITKTKILFVLSLTLCSALVAESFLGLGKTQMEKFGNWLEKQKVDNYEAIYAKALQYVETKQSSIRSRESIDFVDSWKELDESKKSGNCFAETLSAIKDVKNQLKKNKLEEILGKFLNPLLKEVEEICNRKVNIYRKGKKVDPLTQANDLLLENTKSEEIFDNIEVAKKLLAKNQNDEVQQLLKDFVALEQIVEQNREGKLVCSDENIELIKTMENTIIKYTFKGWPSDIYDMPDGIRLKQLVKATTEQVGKVCLEPLVEQFNSLEPKLDQNRTRALKQLSNYQDLEVYKPRMLNERARRETPINLSQKAGINWADRFYRMNIVLYGEQTLTKWDPLERSSYAPIEFVQEKYDDLVVKTCKHFERQDLIPIIEETLRIARSVRLYLGSAPGAFVKNGLADVASNYVVCKRLKNIDQSELVQILANYLPRAEYRFHEGGLSNRHYIESGC